jgi:NitT/TauT family transport system ATP-binding protein
MHMRRRLQQDLERIFQKDIVTVLMVTHDVDEAVFLSDRVLVMSSESEIVADIPITIERPRNRSTETYHSLVNKLTDILHGINTLDERRGDKTAAADRKEARYCAC